MVETHVVPLEVQSNMRDQPHAAPPDLKPSAHLRLIRALRQLTRFSLVGAMNTVVDLFVLNALLLLFPVNSTFMLLVFNALAYSLGATNSFVLNKYWTFGDKNSVTRSELLRFAITTLCGIALSSSIIWLVSNVPHPFLLNPTLWANASKIFAVTCTSLISYLVMNFWVFVRKPMSSTK